MGHHKMQGLPLVLYCFKDRTWSNASIFWLLQGHKVWLILPMTFISTSFINHKSFIFVGEFFIHHFARTNATHWKNLKWKKFGTSDGGPYPCRFGFFLLQGWRSSSPSSQVGGSSSRSCCLADLAMVESQNTKLKPLILESENWLLLIGQIIGKQRVRWDFSKTLVLLGASLFWGLNAASWQSKRAKGATFWANSEVFQPLLKSVASSHPTSGKKHEKTWKNTCRAFSYLFIPVVS